MAAFYSARVDDDGNEMERRETGRTFISSSARSMETKSSVRYINTAASIEKTEDSDGGSMNLDFDTQSNIVPSLDLGSEENYPTTNNYTFSCRKSATDSPDNAFKNWLSAKRKIMSDEAARRKKKEDKKKQEQEDRKRLAKEKFQEWMESKKTVQPRTKTSRESEDNYSRSQTHEEETRLRLEEWEHRKRLEEEHKRLLKREENERRRALDEERRQLAEEAWKKWIAVAANKPKPVPLNRGIFTLRGTISDIYVNPNEWKNIIPENEQE